MKYFTSEWWASGCDDETVFKKYHEYLSSISSDLPKRLLTIQNEFTLHDANVKEIHSSFADDSVTIKLLGWDRVFKERIAYTLRYSGVDRFEQILPQEEYVESELGDLGYWEYEYLGNSTEMRMLFASGAEFTIIFNGFNFIYETAGA